MTSACRPHCLSQLLSRYQPLLAFFLAAGLGGYGCGRPEPAGDDRLRADILPLKALNLAREEDRLEGVQRLEGLLEQDSHATMESLRAMGPDWIQLPDLLASTALAALRQGYLDTATEILGLSLALQPHHPLSNGIKGIELALRRHPAARQYLEKADAWNQANPWIDHALGSLLLQSPQSADQARGKWLLQRVIATQHGELSLAAATLLLAHPSLPFVNREATVWLETLDQANRLQTLPADHLRFIGNRLAKRDLALGKRIGAILWERSTANGDDRQAIARWFLLSGDTTYGDQLLQDASDSTEAFGLQALLYLAKGQSVACLEHLAKGPTQLSEADAEVLYRQLLPQAGLPISEETALIEHGLLEQPLRPPLRFALLSRMVALGPLQTDRWARLLKERWIADDPIAAARWLASIGDHDGALAVLDDMPATPSTALLKGDLLVRAERPDDAIQTLLSLTDASPDREYLLARAEGARGDVEAARRYWTSAHSTALQHCHYRSLKNLGILAWEWDWPERARESLLAAHDAGIEMSLPQLILLQELTLGQQGAGAARRIAASLHRRYPNNPELLNAFAYLSSLAGYPTESLLADLREALRRQPDIQEYRLTLAFLTLQSGRQWEALRLLEQGNLDWKGLGNRSRLIYALVLHGADQGLLADGIAASVDRTTLTAEEIELLEKI
jgi:hypothetical protein